jgi:hypothetical protein
MDGWDVVIPKLPANPVEALEQLRSLCNQTKPYILVSTGSSTLLCKQLSEYRRICLLSKEPPSELLCKFKKSDKFHQGTEISDDLIEQYRKMEDNTVEMKPLVGKKRIERKLAIEKNTPSAGQNAPSVEQLTQLVEQLYSRNQQLAEALNEKNTALMFKRLDYLFKVIESSHMFSDEFVDKCIDELQRTLDITQEENKEETEVNEDGEQD